MSNFINALIILGSTNINLLRLSLLIVKNLPKIERIAIDIFYSLL